MSVRIVLAVTLAVSLQSSLCAITLEDVSKSVFNENPEIKERLEHYRDAKHDYEISKAGFLPRIDLSATTGREKYKITPKGGAATTDSQLNTKTYGATLNQNIFNGFLNYHDLLAQKNRVLSAEVFLKEKSDEILLSLVENYLATQKKYEQIEIAKDNVDSHKKTYLKIKERREVGYSTVSELWQAESRYVLAQSNLVSAELNYQDTVAKFTKLFGKKINGKDLKKPEFELDLPNSLDDAIAISLENNPSVITESFNTKTIRQQYRGSYASFYPKIDFDLSATKSENSSGIEQTIESYSGAFKLYYNLFSGFADYEKSRKYLTSVNAQTAVTEKVKREVLEKLDLAWNSYILIARQIDFLTQHVDLSKKTLDAYQEEFLLGRRTIIDLLGAESEYNDAKKELVGAQFDLLFAKYRVYDAMYGLTDAIIKRDDAIDKDVKSVVFKRPSPDAVDSEKRIQKALEKNKKVSEAGVVPVVPTVKDVLDVNSTLPAKPLEFSEPVQNKDLNQSLQQVPTPINETKVMDSENIIKDALEKNKKAEATSTIPEKEVAVPLPAKPAEFSEPPQNQDITAPLEHAPVVEPIKPVVKVSPPNGSTKLNIPVESVKCYRVNTDRLAIRARAISSSKKVGFLLRNWKVCGEIDADGWIKMPKGGWVSSAYTTPI